MGGFVFVFNITTPGGLQLTLRSSGLRGAAVCEKSVAGVQREKKTVIVVIRAEHIFHF